MSKFDVKRKASQWCEAFLLFVGYEVASQPHLQLSLTPNPSPKGEGSDYQCRVNILSKLLLFKGIHHHPISNTYHPISNTHHPITNTPCRWVKEAFSGVEKVLKCGYQWRIYYHFGGWRMIYISIVNLIIFEDNCFAVLSFYVTFAGNIR